MVHKREKWKPVLLNVDTGEKIYGKSTTSFKKAIEEVNKMKPYDPYKHFRNVERVEE